MIFISFSNAESSSTSWTNIYYYCSFQAVHCVSFVTTKYYFIIVQQPKWILGVNLALEVPQWFIAVLISPDPTFHKTNGCQAGTLELFEKFKMAAKMAAEKTKNRKLHKTIAYCRKWSCSSTFLGFLGSRNPNLIFSDSKWPPYFQNGRHFNITIITEIIFWIFCFFQPRNYYDRKISVNCGVNEFKFNIS